MENPDKLPIFDYCIIDEAGQLTEPQILGPLRKCKKIVLLIYNNQLPPLVKSKQSINNGINGLHINRLDNTSNSKFNIMVNKT